MVPSANTPESSLVRLEGEDQRRRRIFAVLNAVLILDLERHELGKLLKLLARPKRFELLTPRFVVWVSPQLWTRRASSALESTDFRMRLGG